MLDGWKDQFEKLLNIGETEEQEQKQSGDEDEIFKEELSEKERKDVIKNIKKPTKALVKEESNYII